MSFIQSPRWFFLLLRARLSERLLDLSVTRTRASAAIMDRASGTAFERFVDRVSPWEIGNPDGYKRRRLRRVLWSVRFPSFIVRDWSYAIGERVLPYGSVLGKFEGHAADVALKADWLYGHDEYAAVTGGDISDFVHWSWFDNLDVPWSSTPESWVLIEDSHGFVTATQYSRHDAVMENDRLSRLWFETYNPDSDEDYA